MRNRAVWRQVMAVFVCALLAGPVAAPAAAEDPAVVGQVVSEQPARLNSLPLPGEATLFDGDQLATGEDAWARLLLNGGEQVHLNAATRARAHQRGEQVEIALAEGRLALRTRGNGLVVRDNGLAILAPEGQAVWQVAHLEPGLTQVSSQHGVVEVRAANRTVSVAAGRSATIRTAAAEEPKGPKSDAGLSYGEKVAILAAVVGGALAIILPFALDDDEEVSPSGL